MADYNSQIIQKFADRLYRQATIMVVVSTILAALVGGAGGFSLSMALGSLPLAERFSFIGSLPANLLAALGGAVILGAAGFVGGQRRALLMKMQAQLALCQMKIEENTRKI